jgi:hypothetical protein
VRQDDDATVKSSPAEVESQHLAFSRINSKGIAVGKIAGQPSLYAKPNQEEQEFSKKKRTKAKGEIFTSSKELEERRVGNLPSKESSHFLGKRRSWKHPLNC